MARYFFDLSELDEFVVFAGERGWFRVPVKGEYEVLRMQNPQARKPMILYRRERAQALTLGADQDDAIGLLEVYRDSKRVHSKSAAKNRRRGNRVAKLRGELGAAELECRLLRAQVEDLKRGLEERKAKYETSQKAVSEIASEREGFMVQAERRRQQWLAERRELEETKRTLGGVTLGYSKLQDASTKLYESGIVQSEQPETDDIIIRFSYREWDRFVKVLLAPVEVGRS